MMTITCPTHGVVKPVFEWCQSDDGVRHLGAKCPECRLWLAWISIFDYPAMLMPTGPVPAYRPA